MSDDPSGTLPCTFDFIELFSNSSGSLKNACVGKHASFDCCNRRRNVVSYLSPKIISL